jgi:hypothetical protein
MNTSRPVYNKKQPDEAIYNRYNMMQQYSAISNKRGPVITARKQQTVGSGT